MQTLLTKHELIADTEFVH